MLSSFNKIDLMQTWEQFSYWCQKVISCITTRDDLLKVNPSPLFHPIGSNSKNQSWLVDARFPAFCVSFMYLIWVLIGSLDFPCPFSLFQHLSVWTIEKAGGRRAGSGLLFTPESRSQLIPLVPRSLLRSSSLTESLEQPSGLCD